MISEKNEKQYEKQYEKIAISSFFSALACLFLQSCNDFLDVDPKHAAYGNPTMEDP